MRILILIFIACVCLCAKCSEKKAACHDTSATEDFAKLGADKAFQNAHESPTMVDSVRIGKMVGYPVAEEKAAAAYLVAAPKGESREYLLLLHEWWGLNENIKREADYWAKLLNVNVLALDLYDGKVGTTPEEATALMQANNEARSRAIIQGAFDYAGDGAKFRTMGWCFGGGWSLQAALLAGKRATACVVYYGMPETDDNKLKNLSAPVVFIHPTKDKWITEEVVSTFKTQMDALGKKATILHYNADHAFANPSSPRYDAAAANEARKVVTEFLEGK